MGTGRFTTSKLQQAKDWLVGQLADGEPHKASALLSAAKDAGIAPRTLQRASVALGTVKTPASNPTRGVVDVWLWRLPE